MAYTQIDTPTLTPTPINGGIQIHSHITNMHPAYHAIRAAQHIKCWGTYTAIRYAQKRGVTCEVLLAAIRSEAKKPFPFKLTIS